MHKGSLFFGALLLVNTLFRAGSALACEGCHDDAGNVDAGSVDSGDASASSTATLESSTSAATPTTSTSTAQSTLSFSTGESTGPLSSSSAGTTATGMTVQTGGASLPSQSDPYAGASSSGSSTALPLVCAPGSQVSCACPGNAKSGAQACNPDGTGYGTCEGCDTPVGAHLTPEDAGTDAAVTVDLLGPSSGGCSTGRGTPSSPALLLLGALSAVAARRRSMRPSPRA